jgi:hypothetical protein
MLVWLNGPFGAGKTTAARQLVDLAPHLRLFDPEWVGFMLRANLSDQPFDDFQELPPWRALVPRVASEIGRMTDQDLVAVQAVLVEDFWLELRSGFAAIGLDVFHVVLDIEEAALRERVAADTVEATAEDWRLSHIDAFHAARGWMTAAADLVVDVTDGEPCETAVTILKAIGRQA